MATICTAICICGAEYISYFITAYLLSQ